MRQLLHQRVVSLVLFKANLAQKTLNVVAIVQIYGNKPQNCAWNAVLVLFLVQCKNS